MSEGHLYRGRGTRSRQLRNFKERYGARGAEVYGKVVGKVAREQAERRGVKIERVRAHGSRTRYGAPERVGSHVARLVGSRYGPTGTYRETVEDHYVKEHSVRGHYAHRDGRRVWIPRHTVKRYHVRRHTARVRTNGRVR